MNTKKCSQCKEVKVVEEFHKDSYRSDGLEHRCKTCRRARDLTRYYALSAEERKDKRLKSKFNISLSTYNNMLAGQGGVCWVCKRPCPSGLALAVDHDRNCCPGIKSCGDCIRGLLCCVCNRLESWFKDSPEVFRRLADYIESGGMKIVTGVVSEFKESEKAKPGAVFQEEDESEFPSGTCVLGLQP